MDRVEPPRHAVGSRPSCGWAASKTASSSSGRRSPAARAARRCSRCGSTTTTCSTPTTRPAAGTCGACVCPPTSSVTGRRSGGCRHRRTAVGAGHSLVRAAGRRPHRRGPHERRRRDRRDRHATAPSTPARRIDVATRASAIEDVQGTRVLVSGASRGLAERSVAGRRRSTRRRPSSSTADRRRGDPNGCRSPRAVTFDGPTGPVHAFDYPPTNPDVGGSRGRAPAVRRLRARRTDHARRGRGIRDASRTSRVAASAFWTSITAVPAATGVPTASGCAGSGASSTCEDVATAAAGLAAHRAARRRPG